MRNGKEQLIDLLSGEYAEDFKAKPKFKPKTEESRLIESFEEINSFYEKMVFYQEKIAKILEKNPYANGYRIFKTILKN